MFNCLFCSRKWDAEELSHTYEPRGEFNGRAAFERVPCCPVCGGEIEENTEGVNENEDI